MAIETSLGSVLPPGVVLPFAGNTAPNGYLMCYGQAVSRTDYPMLFLAIGTTYGVGDGTTTFNMPDCRGRVDAGKDDMGGVSAARLSTTVSSTTLGGTGGAQTHQLTAAQMPSHSHSLPMYGNVNSVTANPAASAAAHSGHYAGTTSAGSDQAHNNTQPTIIFNKIIKY